MTRVTALHRRTAAGRATMTVQYLDARLTPIYLEYDSFDPLRPDARTDDVWDSESRTVEARRGQTTIRLAIDSDMAAVNGVPLRLDQPAAIVAGRTVVPLRCVAEQFGLKVETPWWDPTARIIRLVSPQPRAPDHPALP